MRRWWLWLLIGVALGGALGVLLGWGIWPVEYYNTAPADLRADYREEYLHLIAATYAVDHDLAAARARLAQLDKDAPIAELTVFTEALILEGAPTEVIAPLVALAFDLDAATPRMMPYLGAPVP